MCDGARCACLWVMVVAAGSMTGGGLAIGQVEGGMTDMQPRGGPHAGPTALRMVLGTHLRRLREEQGVTREAAGWEIRASESKISRMELGRVSFKERDVADLLTLYGVTDDAERNALLDLCHRANTPGWWHRDSELLPGWFQSYLGLEAAAALMRVYEVQFVHGLLQTADYARAVIRLDKATAPTEELDRRVALRMKRQELLVQQDPPTLWCVIDEAVLRRPMGGKAVMAAQIAALMDAADLPNVTIQIIPFAAGGHAAAGGAFTILRFREPDLADTVYIEQLTSALYLDKRDDVEQYAAAMEKLSAQARQPDETSKILGQIRRDYVA